MTSPPPAMPPVAAAAFARVAAQNLAPLCATRLVNDPDLSRRLLGVAELIEALVADLAATKELLAQADAVIAWFEEYTDADSFGLPTDENIALGVWKRAAVDRHAARQSARLREEGR